MPLRNRVDPFGEIHADSRRGLFTGNRGVIHDPASRTLLKRRWSTKAWIICVCDYKGRKRDVMGRNTPSGNAGWTELFFLDEITALAAGHRPCFFCQREKAREFADCFGRAFGVARTRVADMDDRLHRERLASGGVMMPIGRDDMRRLPDGAMIFDGTSCYAIRDGSALGWTLGCYDRVTAIDDFAQHGLHSVTPTTTLEVLKMGYRPVWHESSPNESSRAFH